MIYFYAAIIGLAGGVCSGLLGVGGGVVMVPAMVLLLKLDTKLAIGTSLAVIVPTAIVGTAKHFSRANVDWKLALIIVPLALVGGYIGAWIATSTAVNSAQLRQIFGVFMVAVGGYMLFGR